MRRSERRLPHWDAVEQPLFVTFRLHGTLPSNRIFVPEVLANAGKAFVAMDRILDGGRCGPSYLRMPEVAAIVDAALQAGESRFERYQLHSYVVMPNHVHVLVTPHVVAPQWLGPLKGFTAHEVTEFWDSAANIFGRMRAMIISSDPIASLIAFGIILSRIL